MTFDRVIQKGREALRQARFVDERHVYTGKRLADGTVTMNGAPPGKFWVRSSDASREAWLVIGYMNEINIPVVIAPDAVGDWRLAYVDTRQATSQSQVIQYQVSVLPPPSSELLPGRITLIPNGGLSVHVDYFWTERGRRGGHTVTLSPPTTPGTWAWARLGYDVTNEMFVQFMGVATDYETPDVELIPNIPAGHIPLDAVWLAAGETQIDNGTYIVSSRQALERKRAMDRVDALLAPTVNDDSTLGYERGSQWWNVSDQEMYLCFDATPGLAVWALVATSGDYGGVGPGVISTSRYGQALIAMPGALTTGRYKIRIYNLLEGARTITRVFGRLEVASGVSAVIVDIHKNGTTIFTNQSHRLTIPAGQTTAETTAIDIPSWGEDEYLDAEIDQIGSPAGSDLTLHIVYHS
jgi:hypothetical protein